MAFSTTWRLPSGHYFGRLGGPAQAHGGATPEDKAWVREIQRQLIRKGYVPGVTDPAADWADGLFGKLTADAVTAFQRAEMPGTRFFGQVWPDDFARLFRTAGLVPSGGFVFGWDASDFDYGRGMRTGHLRAAHDEGIRFFTHKVSEWGGGGRTVHKRCGEMLTAARDAGMVWFGAYVVARSGRPVADQARFAVDTLDAQAPGLIGHQRFRWQVDTEVWRDSHGVVYDHVSPKTGAALLTELNRRTGKPVGFHYAPKWAYGDSIPGTDPLWASDYRGSGAPADWRTEWQHTGQDRHPGWAPYSGRVPAILQFSSDSVIGGQHTCDCNAFRGSEADLIALIG
ncbi:peptidoglycan-binding protein [Actinoplanes oblitus]|uniref:Peptidoglycan-binding protein n=1 Tax=Actinoplanes oblitus TaxID=3040509 RepID=A0ABY8W9L2_9ACTN|nr:peptidoglycan-binding protein [Actinoplanes oblitus]WIM94358.1 peptidoglycan-binding protein [Actinoplanes oblitus]